MELPLLLVDVVVVAGGKALTWNCRHSQSASTAHAWLAGTAAPAPAPAPELLLPV
jgi:hypothetical protein